MVGRARLPLLLLLVVGAVLLAWFSARWAKRQLDIDACLDHGGCWDAAHRRCSDIQADCQPRP